METIKKKTVSQLTSMSNKRNVEALSTNARIKDAKTQIELISAY
jgi:hypothetical protein